MEEGPWIVVLTVWYVKANSSGRAVQGKGLRLIAYWDCGFGFRPTPWMSVSCECCVLADRHLCDRPVPLSEHSYRLWCVILCCIEISRMRRSWSASGYCAREKRIDKYIFLFGSSKFSLDDLCIVGPRQLASWAPWPCKQALSLLGVPRNCQAVLCLFQSHLICWAYIYVLK